MILNDRNYLRTLPTAALVDAAKYANNELALVLAERLTEAQADIGRLWGDHTNLVAYWQRKAADATLDAANQAARYDADV
jgi:hypothetical protein